MCPESVEVAHIAIQLRKLLIGKILIDINCDKNSRYSTKGIPGFEYLKFPYICSEIRTRGKKIIITLDKDGYQVYVISFLGMAGRWLEKPLEHSNLCMVFETSKSQKEGDTSGKEEEKDNPDVMRMYFDDSRHFGTFTIYPNKKELDSFISRTTGPDLLTDDVTLDEWTKKIRNPRIKNKEVCLFLLDQKQFSGIGVYLRAEILYECKINPHRSLGQLSDQEVELILEVTKQKLKESFESGGLTIRDYLTPDGKKGNFKQVIYGKIKDPLGNRIIKEADKNGRMNHWVPQVQK